MKVKLRKEAFSIINLRNDLAKMYINRKKLIFVDHL